MLGQLIIDLRIPEVATEDTTVDLLEQLLSIRLRRDDSQRFYFSYSKEYIILEETVRLTQGQLSFLLFILR